MKLNLLLCLVLAGSIVPCNLRAAETNAVPPRPDPGQVRERQMNPSPGAGMARVFMVLTPEQRDHLRQAAGTNRDKVRVLEEKLRVAPAAALDASLAKPFNEVVLREKLDAAAKLETELTLIRAATLAKVEPPLSDEQIAQIKNPPPPGDMRRQRPGPPFRGGQPPPADGERDENGLPPPPKP